VDKNELNNWLETLPKNWFKKRVKHILFEINEKSETGDEELLSLSQYTGVELKKNKLKDANDNLTNAKSLVGYKKVLKNHLVSNIMLAWNGSVAVSSYDGIISPAYCVYKYREGYNPKFFEYLFKTEIYKAEFKRRSTGIIESRLRLYSDKFYNVPIVIPDLDTQNEIVNFIDLKKKQVSKIVAYNSLIFGKTNPKTGFLQEYINAIIISAISGKVSTKITSEEIDLDHDELYQSLSSKLSHVDPVENEEIEE
jgi:type I restriction enzyme S subunit